MNNKEQVLTNHLIPYEDFSRLARVHDQHCTSIYIPTSRAGEEVDRNHGPITLKNVLKNLTQTLRDHKLNEKDIENYLSPVYDLMEDGEFWRNQSDCLAIFLNNQQMQYYSLPIIQDTLTYFSDHFNLLPVIPLFSDDGKYYVLSLSLQEVKLFEGTRHSITELYVEDLLPEKLEEVVGYDYQNKSLQFRSGKGGGNEAIFHGQGAGKDDKARELEKFFRVVDKGLMKLIKDEKAPLILACVDHYHPMYAKITSYGNLFNSNISGNQEETDPLVLQEKAWSLIGDDFKKSRESRANQLKNQSIDGKSPFDINDIIPAVIDGRVETLFLQKEKDKYGLYDKVNRSLILDEDVKRNQASLFNLAAVQTWLKGGKVYLVEKEEMPFHGTSMNALFRY